MPLRYFQDDAKFAVLCALEEFDRVLLHLGTGGGKTVIAAHLIADLQPHRCLFLADQDELCQQPLTVISKHANIIPALEKASYRASHTARVVVASSQTLSRTSRLQRFPPGWFKYAIVDEAHRGAERDKKILDHLGCKAVGITATPFKADLRDLSKYYEHVAFSMPMIDLVKDGFAPRMRVHNLPLEIDLADVKVKQGFDGKDYDAASLSTTIAPYYEEIIRLLIEHTKGRHTIVFLPLIWSSQAFATIARSLGVSAIHVDGQSEDRDAIIEGFKMGRYSMLCNADLVGTGVDIPIADCLVNLAPTWSAVRYQQRVGRIMRPLPGVVDDLPDRDQAEERIARIKASSKPDALIMDFLWQHEKLGVMRPGHLVASNEDEAKAIFEKAKDNKSPEDLLEIRRWVQEEREANLVKQLEKVSDREGAIIEPAAFGYLIGSRTLQDYEPVTMKEAELPTQRQMDKLKEWGIDIGQVKWKGQASKLIDAMMHRFRFHLASTKQLQELQAFGIEFDPWKLTRTKATDLLAETKLRKIRS